MIRVDRKVIKQVASFSYFGGVVCKDGGNSKEPKRNLQAGAAGWRREKGIMWEKKLKNSSRESIGNIPCNSCVYGLGTFALTERQEEKVLVAENNYVRRICKVKREDRWKMGN